jgi:hypothetical protein
LNAAAIDRFVRDRVEASLAWARRRLVTISIVFAGLGLALVALRALAPVHGLRGRIFPNPEWSGPPAATTLDRVINFPKDVLAIRADDSDRLSAVWEGYVFAPKRSVYRFTVRSDDGARIYVDGTLAVDNGGVHPAEEAGREIPLARGSHPLRIEYFDAGDEGVIDFRWRETKTPRSLMPRLPLYPRSITLGLFVWDTVQANLRPLVRTGLLVAGLLLILGAGRAAFPRWEALQVLALSLFVVLAVAYEADVLAKKSTAVSGCDSYAYLQGAELMARNGIFRTEFTDPLAAEIVQAFPARPRPENLKFLLAPLGYYLYDPDKGLAYNVFPPGLSFLLFPVVKLFGRAPVFYLLPGLNAALLVLFFGLATRAGGAAFGLVLAAVTFFNRPVFETSVVLMSDLPSLGLLALAAFLFSPSLGFPRLGRILLAGASFGLAVLVRYSNLVAAVPLAYLFWREYRRNRNYGRLAGAVAAFGGAAVLCGPLPLALYTHRLFGTALRLVYEPISQSRMSWLNFGPGVSYYGSSLLRTFGPLTLAAVLIGAIAGLLRPKLRPAALLGLLAFIAFFLFYAANDIRNERYLVPAYPVLGLLAAFGLAEILTRFRRSFVVAGLAVALIGASPLLRSKGTYRGGEIRAEDAVAALARKLPSDAVVFCEDLSGPVRFYAGLSGYRFIATDEATLFQTADILRAKGRPVFFLLDIPAAEVRFEWLVERHPDFREGLHDQGRVRGRPLWGYSPPER